MGILATIVPVIGIGLCTIALLQCALWSAQSLGYLVIDRRRFNQRRVDLQASLTPARLASQQGTNNGWQGFRSFRVDRLVKETSTCRSVYLVPEDSKPIPGFRPGQHLTLRLKFSGESKPIVRCYSLSDAPDKPYFRISVKQVAPPLDRPDLPPGKASHFINNELRVGDLVEVKSPAGNFCLEDHPEKPAVFLAGGIGITPMISMLEYLVNQHSKRMVLLAYGVNGSADHAFKDYLARTSKNLNVHLLTCYAQAAATDKIGVDYHFDGFISVDLLRQVLPDNDCDFYLCGPPPFMESLYAGLIGWGVLESNIRVEAFGPASIGKARKISADESATIKPTASISFANSNAVLDWDGSCDSLLELAEANQIEIDSGCRAGSCGTCSTDLIAGKVKYPDAQEVSCEPGQCLVCVAKPDGPVELGA